MKEKIKNSRIINFIKYNIGYIIFLMLLIVVLNIPLPYYIMAPGGIIDISNRINIEGKSEMEGTLNLLYVTEYEANVTTMLLSYIIKDWDTEKIEEMQVSNETMEEISVRNKVMLNNSMQSAILVAYQKAGKTVNIKDKENIVIATTKQNENLKIGDIILKANGVEIDNMDTLKTIISNTPVGKSITMDIKRDGKQQSVSCTVKEEDNNKVIGIMMITNYIYEVDPEVELEFKSSEGGSSGGLMIALNIYNSLISEDITKGRKIAGTGTIEVDGTVGAIDGVKYKLIGAVNNGMEIVLVPKENYEEAMKVKEEYNFDIEIVSVNTFDDALNYLQNS